jgi:anti-anti-sigma regulatory factor
MNIIRTAIGLEITNIEDLTAATCDQFASSLLPQITQPLEEITITFSPQTALDCSGVAAIVAVRNQAQHFTAHVNMRLLNTPPAAKRLLSLVGLDQWCSSPNLSKSGMDTKPPDIHSTVSPIAGLTLPPTIEPGTGLSAFA